MMIRNHIVKLILAYYESSETLIQEGMDPWEAFRELDSRVQQLTHLLHEIDQSC